MDTKWLDEVFRELQHNDESIQFKNVIFDTEQAHSEIRKVQKQKTTTVTACGWLDDDEQTSMYDKDNPVKISKLDWNIEGMEWEKDGYGNWREKQPRQPAQPDEDLIIKFKKLGICIDVMPQGCNIPNDMPQGCNNTNDMYINKMKQDEENIKFNLKATGQSDSGANASATNNLALLEDVTWIKPMWVGTANGAPDGGITMQAVGKLTIPSPNGDTLKVACYYSPDMDGTIISPQAVAMEYKERFFGWIHFCNVDNKTGYIRFCNRPNQRPFSTGIWSENNLWYQSLDQSPHIPETTKCGKQQPRQFQINKLNTAAEYELWHQRLSHCGEQTMEKMHDHAINIPKLKGRNAFYRCSSCMRGKITKQRYTRNRSQYRNQHI